MCILVKYFGTLRILENKKGLNLWKKSRNHIVEFTTDGNLYLISLRSTNNEFRFEFSRGKRNRDGG